MCLFVHVVCLRLIFVTMISRFFPSHTVSFFLTFVLPFQALQVAQGFKILMRAMTCHISFSIYMCCTSHEVLTIRNIKTVTQLSQNKMINKSSSLKLSGCVRVVFPALSLTGCAGG